MTSGASLPPLLMESHGDEGASCKTQQNTVGMEPGPSEYCLSENVVNHIGGGVIRLAGLAEAADVFEVIA